MAKKKTYYIIYIMLDSIFKTDEYPGIPESQINYNHIKRYYMYAWTTSKELLEDFFSQRDTKIFSYDKITTESHKLYGDLYELQLGYRKYHTRQEQNGKYKIVPIKILSTLRERDLTSIDYKSFYVEELSDEISEFSLDTYFANDREDYQIDERIIDKYESIFNENIRKALEELGFNKVIKDYGMFCGERMPFHEYEVDEFSIYLRLFINTYKEKG